MIALVLQPAYVRAHRLEADYRVLPEHKVQVESWFDSTGDPPLNAVVQVFGEDGRLLTEGRLDDRGVFVFSYQETGPLRVVVAAGAGHRKEIVIPGEELGKKMSAAAAKSPAPFADRSSRVSVKDVLVGIGFLLAAAAFVLSLRNARHLAELKARANPSSPDQVDRIKVEKTS